jgi:hypothetical protein
VGDTLETATSNHTALDDQVRPVAETGINYNGGVDAPGNPELKFLHAESTLNRVKIELFRSLPTDELILSLAPGRPGALKVRLDGTVLDGHHRLRALIDRGVDIRHLPREIMERKS